MTKDKGSFRNTKQRVKTAKGRKLSSSLWLERQLNDPYVKFAKQDGYHSRAAYKLLEAEEKHKFIKPGQIAIDLGAAPGSWSQILVKKINPEKTEGKVIALDLLDIKRVKEAIFVRGDFLDLEIQKRLIKLCGGKKADIILSDMAPSTLGNRSADHLRIMGLADEALYFCKDHLRDGGSFFIKIFQGGDEKKYVDELKTLFSEVKYLKPKSSRADSKEIYVFCRGFQKKSK